MMTIIFHVILALLHSGYVAFTYFTGLWAYARRHCVNICQRWQYSHDEYETKIEFDILLRNIKKIQKFPSHLVIAIGHDERISFLDLVRILGWCIAVGIPYVSFYDHNGFLKQHQNVLRDECEKTRPKIANLIDWESQASTRKLTENGCTGFKRKTRVQVFSNADGKGEIVTLAQNLSRAVTIGLLKMEEIDTELLNDKLRLEDTPDPDVVFVCGPALSSYGLLPWHTRTTEFLNLRSHRDMSVHDFTFLLETYSLCAQRYGK